MIGFPGSLLVGWKGIWNIRAYYTLFSENRQQLFQYKPSTWHFLDLKAKNFQSYQLVCKFDRSIYNRCYTDMSSLPKEMANTRNVLRTETDRKCRSQQDCRNNHLLDNPKLKFAMSKSSVIIYLQQFSKNEPVCKHICIRHPGRICIRLIRQHTDLRCCMLWLQDGTLVFHLHWSLPCRRNLPRSYLVCWCSERSHDSHILPDNFGNLWIFPQFSHSQNTTVTDIWKDNTNIPSIFSSTHVLEIGSLTNPL